MPEIFPIAGGQVTTSARLPTQLRLVRQLAGPVLAAGWCLGLAACDRSPPQSAGTAADPAPAREKSAAPAATAGTDFRSVAARVVGRSAGVTEGDLVLLTGDVRDLPLLEEMAVQVRRRGADALVSVGTERLGRRMYDEVPAKYDRQAPEFFQKLAGVIDVSISTESAEGRTLKGVPPDRMAARGQAFQPVLALMQKRGVRSVALGNGLYPTAERAEQFGMSRAALAALMYGGIDADYEGLQAAGEAMRKRLAGGRELRITSPAGTNFTVGIGGRPILVSDGVISAEDRKQGGAATSVWLPAGEVYLTPVPGTAQGVIVADHIFFEGGRIDGLRLQIKDGKMTSMTAKSDLARLRALHDAAGRGKDDIGVVDFGINPAIRLPEGAPVNVWSRAGALTVGVGNNVWAGGDNGVSFGIAPEVPKATVTVDGRELVKDGRLVGTPALTSR